MNLMNKFNGWTDQQWPLTFGTTCWLLWKHRNKSLFEDSYSITHDILPQIIAMVRSFVNAYESLETSSMSRLENLISWNPPSHPWVKLNMDGGA